MFIQLVLSGFFLMDQTSTCKFPFLRRTAETMAEPGDWDGGGGLSCYLFKSANLINFVKLMVGPSCRFGSEVGRKCVPPQFVVTFAPHQGDSELFVPK